MSFTEIAAKAVELAQSITFFTGDWKASAILALVKHFLQALDGTSVAALIQSIFGISLI